MKKLLALMLLLVPCIMLSAQAKVEKQNTSKMEQETSKTMDEIFLYFHNLGTKKLIDEKKQEQLFSPDFQMITNDIVITKDRSELTEHFEEIMAQAKRIDLIVQDKIVSGNTCVMKYTLLKQDKQKCNVIAIFKFKKDSDGKLKTYLMDEVVFRTPLK